MPNPLKVSVILCSHNPRLTLLESTLEALGKQSLKQEKWELLIIDNASTVPISYPPPVHGITNCEVIREPKIGLTNARLCGITNSRADLIVFVDDDAVLDSNYLSTASRLAEDYPFLGAFGGSIILAFSEPPPQWSKPHWPKLAARNVTKPMWSNFNSSPTTTPWGVGMCVRRQVAIHYVNKLSSDITRKGLDRSGTSLVSGGDDDLARTSHELGLATAIFPELQLIHNIPPERLTETYLLKLTEAQSYSGEILRWIYGEERTLTTRNLIRSIIGKIVRFVTLPRRDRLFLEASYRGRVKAANEIETKLNRSQS